MYRLIMMPPPGERLLRFVGDHIKFTLRTDLSQVLAPGAKAFLRTNLGRAEMWRQEIISAHTGAVPKAGISWRDIPLSYQDGEWSVEMPLSEVGFFKAKPYLRDVEGRQFWPEGPDVGVTVHPDRYRSGNTVYCAFVRLFGVNKATPPDRRNSLEVTCQVLDQKGYTVIPPSGTFRDLIKELPLIIQQLGCRIIHLLPVNPTPTTKARFGRFGSPYAALDFNAVDPALMEFDKRTTGLDQFEELAQAIHRLEGRLFIDLAINHTGWGSKLQELRPEWFLRQADGTFLSPGAWGTIWEDLVELRHAEVALWDHLAQTFIFWCRHGVDGFRCDAGYKVPLAAWQYIIARVRQEFPEALFLLEGLGGAWETTEALLTEGGMQWAYSELFQNYSGREVASYLDYALPQSQRMGLWIHYSETHDNPRLAARGRAWSLLRNRLCGLTSVNGGFAFTCGVEWLAAEKISVHQAPSLNWGSSENIVLELSRLNRLLRDHPCFLDGAQLTRLSSLDGPVYALQRVSRDGRDRVLVLVNTDPQHTHFCDLPHKTYSELGSPRLDLLGQADPHISSPHLDQVRIELGPGACLCLAPREQSQGLQGDEYRRVRAQSAWALAALCQAIPMEKVGAYDWMALAHLLERLGPASYLSAVSRINPDFAPGKILAAIEAGINAAAYPPVIHWTRRDVNRILLVPPRHWLLVSDPRFFRLSLECSGRALGQHGEAVMIGDAYYAFIPPGQSLGEARLILERFSGEPAKSEGRVRFLRPVPQLELEVMSPAPSASSPLSAPSVLFTNGLGGMARVPIDLGAIKSKYDCWLGANLHPEFPVDRHVFVKRVRVWVNADGFLSPLNQANLVEFSAGPPARWRFLANAGDGRKVALNLMADLMQERNCVVLKFNRPASLPPGHKGLPENCEVRLTVRVDIEDRNFHWETRHNGAAEHHFSSHSHALSDQIGFAFTPAPDRKLAVTITQGAYHPQPEWSLNIPHPVEQSRGQTGSGDAFSPGWFEIPMAPNSDCLLVLNGDLCEPPFPEVASFIERRQARLREALAQAAIPEDDTFARRLVMAIQAFIVRRGQGRTLIAGYPWFLDWGRDTFIGCRGLLAAGFEEVVNQILLTFAQFEDRGTLPNNIHGQDAANRDTSDAPLWFGVVCHELSRRRGPSLFEQKVDSKGRSLRDVLISIALGYLRGTANGIRVDPLSGLVWSPCHFTWMDTNYPAATPREGYPVEIQVLWIETLNLLAALDRISPQKIPDHAWPAGLPSSWEGLAGLALTSFREMFWLEEKGYFADVLLARAGESARKAVPDQALRSNYLFAVSLGLIKGEPARRCVQAAMRYLVVPGALRSLAPLPVQPPLPVRAHDGRLLNNPNEPYWGRYEGDEDTRRKPAYHNGTAWTWTFPAFCEALARAWELSPEAVDAAKALLGSMDGLLQEQCLGHLPEVLDGDAPHWQRGCDAQAWSATEALRVWKWLCKISSPSLEAAASSYP